MLEEWKRTVASAASAKRQGKGAGVASPLLGAAGEPQSIRSARKSLFTLSRSVLSGRPHMIAIEPGAIVVMISLSDLVWVLERTPETLAEGLAESGFKPAKRGRPRGS